MWWPAIGSIGIGVGGFFFPRGLGVGYDNIAELLRGNAPMALLLGLLVAKSRMWAFSASSGTSGGVLAPLLMIGAALGESVARLAHIPGETQALWALMGMGAMLSSALGVPLIAIPFSLELTHALPALLPLTLACTASYLVTSLVMPQSILTEKLIRRGYHLSREYGVDPLEMVSVAEVMTEHSASAEAGQPSDLPEALLDSYRFIRKQEYFNKFMQLVGVGGCFGWSGRLYGRPIRVCCWAVVLQRVDGERGCWRGARRVVCGRE